MTPSAQKSEAQAVGAASCVGALAADLRGHKRLSPAGIQQVAGILALQTVHLHGDTAQIGGIKMALVNGHWMIAQLANAK